MRYRINVKEKTGEVVSEVVVIAEGANWFSALVQGLTELDYALDMRGLKFTVLDDGVSAIVENPILGQRFEIVIESLESSKTHKKDDPPFSSRRTQMSPNFQPPIPHGLNSPPSNYRPRPNRAPKANSTRNVKTSKPAKIETLPEQDQDEISAQPKITIAVQKSSGPEADAFGQSGMYTPGKTGDFLTHTFMNLSDLFERFSNEREKAAQFLLEASVQILGITGGCVLFHDINDPKARLILRAAIGPNADQLLGREIKMGQGPIGVCANFGVSLNISNLTRKALLAGGIIDDVGLKVGPILCVPILREDWLQGVIVGYRRPGAREFNPSELGILEHIGSIMGAYLCACRAWEDQNLELNDDEREKR